jgi:UDP-glucose:(heptosyl)LPS alpha-1,3-glucosyltransferase
VPNGIEIVPRTTDLASSRARIRAHVGVQDDETLFLFSAHNPRLKGIRPLLDAALLLRDWQPRFRIVAIGREPDGELRQRVARLELGPVVHFGGFFDDPTAYYAAADAFVLPTYYDACSLTVLEACAFGLPVVTSRRNGASEHITSGREGFVVDDPADVTSLARSMLFLTDSSIRARMSPNALLLAEERELGRTVDALEAVFADVVSRRERA